MAKKDRRRTQDRPAVKDQASEPQGATLKDLLGADTISKLKAQAEEMKQAEAARKEQLRKQEEEAKKQEQKRLENDFAYLLEKSDQNWSKYK